MDFANRIQFSGDPQKQTIFNAALYEFAENGFKGTTIRQIAKRAEIAHGLIYYYFKDKKTLYLELCRLIRSNILSAVSDNTDSDNIYDTLLNICRNKLDLLARYPNIYKVVMDEIRLFPREYKAEREEFQKSIPVWAHLKGALSGNDISLEILEAALSGMTENLLNRYCAGLLSADELLPAGMEKARIYIEFFKNLP